MKDSTRFDLESDWLPLKRAWGVIPLAFGLANLIAAFLLVRAVGWSSVFLVLMMSVMGVPSLGYGAVTLYVKRVFAGWRPHSGDLAYDSPLSKAEREEIFGAVHALATDVANFLGVPVRNEVPLEVSGAGPQPARGAGPEPE